jgi:uncharacterized DUF497 family protein
MDFEFDPGKDEINRLKHGVSLALGAEVVMNRFGQIGDERRDYGEERFNAFGLVKWAAVRLYLIRCAAKPAA